MFSPKQTVPSKKVLQNEYETRCVTYEKILNDLQQRIKLDLNQINIVFTIKVRVKSFDSYYKKLLKLLNKFKSRQEDFLIYDTLGLRIVCPFLNDLKFAENLIKEKYHIIEMDHKGNQYSFKEFGYESIHFLIKVPTDILSHFQLEEAIFCEIQLNTILQDAWSEVEHELVYKTEFSPFDEPLKRKLAALNAILSLSDTLFQEIRDYQHRLQSELRKRRKAFVEKIQHAIDGNTHKLNQDITFGKQDKETDSKIGGFQETVDINIGENIDNLLLKALEAHNAKHYKKAINVYTLILNQKMEQHIASIILIHRGMAYFSDSNYEEALRDFTKSLRLNPENGRAFYCRAVIHQTMQNYTGALEDLNQCLKSDPYRFDLLYNRSRVYFHLCDYPKALADCELALKIEPESSQAQKLKKLIGSYIIL